MLQHWPVPLRTTFLTSFTMNNGLCIYVILLILGLNSCVSEVAPQVPLKCEPPAIVSFQQDILPIFNKSCNTAGCHAGTNPGGNLNLEPGVAWNELMTGGYIDTINPKFSILYAQMNSVSNPMPPTGKLDSCTIQLIFKWIEQKAKNN